MSGQRLARVYLQGEWRILVVTNMAGLARKSPAGLQSRWRARMLPVKGRADLAAG